MEKEFDFSAFGKVNPYKVPDGFFDELPQQTLALAKKRAASHKRITLIAVTSLSAAASVALFVALPFIANQTSPTNNRPTVYVNSPVVSEADSTQVTTVETPTDSITTVPKAVKTQSPAPVAAQKPENIDALLAELSMEELMQMADTGDDDNFIND